MCKYFRQIALQEETGGSAIEVNSLGAGPSSLSCFFKPPRCSGESQKAKNKRSVQRPLATVCGKSKTSSCIRCEQHEPSLKVLPGGGFACRISPSQEPPSSAAAPRLSRLCPVKQSHWLVDSTGKYGSEQMPGWEAGRLRADLLRSRLMTLV